MILSPAKLTILRANAQNLASAGRLTQDDIAVYLCGLLLKIGKAPVLRGPAGNSLRAIEGRDDAALWRRFIALKEGKTPDDLRAWWREVHEKVAAEVLRARGEAS